MNINITRKGFYANVSLMYELIHQCKDREVFFLPIDPVTKKASRPIRWLMAQYIGMLKRHFEQYGFLDKNMNIYHSLATYQNRPMFSYSWLHKSQEQELWKEHYREYLEKLDLFLETDSTDIMQAKEDILQLKNVLDKFKIRYSQKFSLAGDTPILIKINDEIKLIEIEKAINYVNFADVLTLEKNNTICWRKITNFISHQDKLINVFHRQGGKIPIQCTADHSAFVLNENYDIIEKKGSELREGDFLVTINNTHNIIKDNTQEINFNFLYNNRKNNKGLKSEKILITNELMWCLGAYLGDGSLSDRQIQLGKSNFELVRRFGNFFGKQGYRFDYRKNYKTLLYVSISSKKWRDFFDYSCGHLAEHKHLPPYIWQVSKDKIYSFVQGYIDTDGQKTDEHFVSIKSKSKTIIMELCWLLKLIGISCRINKEVTKSHPNPKGQKIKGFTAYMISINREEMEQIYPKYFKVRNKFSPEAIDNCLPTNIFRKLLKQIKPKIIGGAKGKRPDGLIRTKDTLSHDFLAKYLDWIEKTNKNNTVEVADIIKRIKNVINSDIRITKITKITYDALFSPVYDISVEETERFYTGKYPLLFQNSGSKGFHVIIPFENMEHLGLEIYEAKKERLWVKFEEFLQTLPIKFADLRKHFDYVLLYKTINMKLKGIYALETLDTSISDVLRVCKMAYSWDVKSNRIALPLNNEQLLNFNLDMVEPINVLKAGVHKRGLMYQNEQYDLKTRQDGFNELLMELGIVK